MKSQKLFSLIFVYALLAISNSAFSQISKGGTPPSFSDTTLKDSIHVVLTPIVNIDSLLTADSLESGNEKLFRFGYAIDVSMGLHNSGTWDTLQNGDKIWRMKISSPDAFSINLIYDDFWLPEGAQFFVYDEDKSMILGAFTATLSNNSYNEFATDLVKGDITILEYFEPSYANGGRINVDKIIHGYKNMFKSGHGGSDGCNIDITCSQGNNWCVEKRAVSMVLVDDNTRWCSGCLANNVREDLTPYYLTANHCLRGDENTWIFRFKYWSPTCNQGDDAGHWVSITGSTIRANHAGSDFALLQLSAQPPSGFGVLYVGWDRTTNAPSSAIGIHHPSGDVMKISFENNSPTSNTWNGTPANSHWQVIWNNGTTEGGSSGSPLFNNNHRIIGQLHGGTASCSNTSGYDRYGKFDVSWNGGGTSATRLRDWLDPDNTGATSVGPTSPTIYLINRALTGTHKFAALEKIHIEGNVATSGPFQNQFCQPSNVPFITEPGSNVDITAKRIVCKPGTHFKVGSTVHIKAVNNIKCSDNLVEGDYVNVFCNAQISMKMGGQNNNASASIDNNSKPEKEIVQDKLNLSESIILYPNPSSGKFEIEFLDNNLISSEIIIYDAAGKIAYEQNKIIQNKISIDFCNFQKGIYLVQIIHIGNSYTKKIILQ